MFPDLRHHKGQIGMGFGRRYRTLECLEALRETSLFAQQQSQIVVGRHVLGILFHGQPQQFLGLGNRFCR